MKQPLVWSALVYLCLICLGGLLVLPACRDIPLEASPPPTVNGETSPTTAKAEPSVDIQAFHIDPPQISSGEWATLYWETARAEQCDIDALGPIPWLELATGERVIAPFRSTIYTLTCHGLHGPVVAQATVRVEDRPVTIVDLHADPRSISHGESVDLHWEVRDAVSCGFDSPIGVVAPLGMLTLSPLHSATYTLRCLGFSGPVTAHVHVEVSNPIINEIAWMGTTTSPNHEWIELYHPGQREISLDGWTLMAESGAPSIALTGTIAPQGYFLLERTSDASVPDVAADQIYTGNLSNAGEVLTLRDADGRIIDRVGDAGPWYTGDNEWKATMERMDPHLPGDSADNWEYATLPYSVGLGTPGAANARKQYPRGGNTPGFELIFNQHHGAVMPGIGSHGAGTASLVEAIEAATLTIDFAIYGLSRSPMILDALDAAIARGVTVRGVVDANGAGIYSYRHSHLLEEVLEAGALVTDQHDALMHNKFFVFDGTSVWTASANLSETDLHAEYNCNVALHIRSEGLARVFTEEFEQMHGGRFHQSKRSNLPHIIPRLEDGTLIQAYFSPADSTMERAILSTIDGAAQTLDIAMYYLTDARVIQALANAQQRGVAIRMILDAEGAANAYSIHPQLRQLGIPVKVENWGGKSHMKAMTADGYVTLLGSQNWTLAGDSANDENVLRIENEALAEAFLAHFEEDWHSIPDTWLRADPHPESADSPGSLTDLVDNDGNGLTDENSPEQLLQVSDEYGAINVYFNRGVLHRYALPGNETNAHVNLEQRLIHRLNAVTASVDVAVYDLNLPHVVNALLDRAADGIRIRLIADAKNPPPDDAHQVYRDAIMRIHLERLLRGRDGLVGTEDDVYIFSESPLFAEEDVWLRLWWGLPETPVGLPLVTLPIGSSETTGYLLAYGERKPDGESYYAAGRQMHHKYFIMDDRWTWTGSWNVTISSHYGDDGHVAAGILAGNTDQVVEIHSRALAGAYRTDFETMWGSSSLTPDPDLSRFGPRKPGSSSHQISVGGRQIELFFSPGSEPLARLTEHIEESATQSVHFMVYAWSYQPMVDALKEKWEGSTEDLEGELTGFDIQGVFSRLYWDTWWSASVDMTGRTMEGSEQNPNTRWANPPPVYRDGEDRKLHTKVMIIDAEGSNPAVVLGSTNWGDNGNASNDDNMLIIHDRHIANQFIQFFHARYYLAGGTIPPMLP